MTPYLFVSIYLHLHQYEYQYAYTYYPCMSQKIIIISSTKASLVVVDGVLIAILAASANRCRKVGTLYLSKLSLILRRKTVYEMFDTTSLICIQFAIVLERRRIVDLDCVVLLCQQEHCNRPCFVRFLLNSITSWNKKNIETSSPIKSWLTLLWTWGSEFLNFRQSWAD